LAGASWALAQGGDANGVPECEPGTVYLAAVPKRLYVGRYWEVHVVAQPRDQRLGGSYRVIDPATGEQIEHGEILIGDFGYGSVYASTESQAPVWRLIIDYTARDGECQGRFERDVRTVQRPLHRPRVRLKVRRDSAGGFLAFQFQGGERDCWVMAMGRVRITTDLGPRTSYAREDYCWGDWRQRGPDDLFFWSHNGHGGDQAETATLIPAWRHPRTVSARFHVRWGKQTLESGRLTISGPNARGHYSFRVKL
jgi:hypothetical protein